MPDRLWTVRTKPILGIFLGLAVIGAAWFWGSQAPPPGDRPIPDLPAAPNSDAQTSAEPLRLTVFGTSLSGSRYHWPDRLADALSDCLGRPVALSRVAGPGQGVSWALTQAPKVIAETPDLVLIEFAVNDAELMEGISPALAAARHSALLADLRAGLPDTVFVLMTMNPAHGLRGMVRPRLDRHYADYGPLAEAEGAGLVDVYGRWRALPRAERRFADGLHPNDAQASAVIVPALLQALAPVLTPDLDAEAPCPAPG